MDEPPKPSRPNEPDDHNKKVLGKSWINKKGEILIYHNGKEYNISNWELVHTML